MTGCAGDDRDAGADEPAGSEDADGSDRAGPSEGAGAGLVVTNVQIFDGERLSDDNTVVVEDGVITAVGQNLDSPSGATVHDGEEGMLLPGLIDAHVHTQDPSQLEDSLRFGVTTVLDMFTTRPELMGGLRDQRQHPERTSRADIWSAGILVTAPGGHGTQFGVPIPVLARGDDADRFVADRLAEGSDYIKIVIDDGTQFDDEIPTLTADQVQAVVEAAHERELLTVVHVSTWEGAATAATAGADLLAHVPSDALPADDRPLTEVAEADMAVVATLAVWASVSCTSDGSELRDDPAIAPHLSHAQHDGLGVEFPRCFHGHLSAALDNVRALHEAGVPILAGTDYPNPGTVPGASMLLELELLERAGLSPADALAAASSGPASRFGLDDRGRIAPDMRADLVLVEGDPTSDVLAARDITAIWKNGHPIERG